MTTTQALAVHAALAELLPGGPTPALDDVPDPARPSGFGRAPGAWRPADVLLTEAVCAGPTRCAGDVEHGHAFCAGVRGPLCPQRAITAGPTFANTAAARASVAAVLAVARTRRRWGPSGLDMAAVRAALAADGA